MADSVQLTDLDVITKYSIAVRKASADRDDLIETLRADLAWLERGVRRTAPARQVDPEPAGEVDEAYDDYEDDDEVEAEPEPPRRAPIRRMPAKVTPSRKPAAKKAAAKKAAAKKAAPRRSGR